MFTKVRPIQNEYESQKLWAFRYMVYLGDCRRGTYNLDHRKKWLTDQLDPAAQHLIAVDQNSDVVGCLRSNPKWATEYPQYLRDWMESDRVDSALGSDKITYTSLLMGEPSMRGRTVASLLAIQMFREGLKLGVELDTCCCELNLVHIYYQLGYRPYGPPFRVEGAGIRVPLVLCGRDREYLDRVGSPFLGFVPEDIDDSGAIARRLSEEFPLFIEPAFEPVPARVAWAILAAGPGSENETEPYLLRDIGEDRLSKVLGAVTRVWFASGDRIYEKGENEIGSGLLVSGRLGIHLNSGPNPHFIAVLGPGEVFGESAAHNDGERTAYVSALEKSEVMLLPPDFVDRARKKDEAVAYQLARNMNEMFARRLKRTNELLASFMRRETGEVVSYQAPADESQELSRLEQQARFFWESEKALLQGLGLEGEKRVLDAGCGTGTLSHAIAREFEGSTVMGVDNSDVMIQRAHESIPPELEGRCDFRVGDVSSLPFLDQSFDFILARFVFQHLLRPREALQEFRRVADLGGTVCILDVDDGGIVMHPEPPEFAEVESLVHKVKREVGGNRRIGRSLRELLVDSGFRQVNLQVVPLCATGPQAAALIPIAFAFKERLLREAGAWSADAEAFFEKLEQLPLSPGGTLVVPIFVATGRRD